MMPLGLCSARWRSGLQWKRWQRLAFKPRIVQTELLRRILDSNRNSSFGREHGFNHIQTVAGFRQQVPVADYERFRPYVKRAMNGEQSVLTAEPILMFTLTSGSTGEPKLIPVTETTRARHASLTALWYGRAFYDHPGCARGKVFGLVGAAVEGHTAGGTPYGAASGLIYQSSPWWIRRIHALPLVVAEIKNFEAKYYAAMRLALEQNIGFVGTPNPSTLLRLVHIADHFSAEVVRDIRDGTLSNQWELPAPQRAALTTLLAPNPGRARELEQMAYARGRLLPSDYWPQLGLIGCWKGGSVGIRLKELETWFDNHTPTRDLGYMASEAHISLPIEDSGHAGILAVDANFYEFIPESEIDTANPVTLGCHELQVGAIYDLIVTTAGGLYRYDMNDLIRVVGFYRNTPLIEFLRKGRDVTNITGEKLHVNQVIQAVEHASQTTGLTAPYFHACADTAMSRYAFMVEFSGAPPDKELLAAWLKTLESRLCQLNVEYAQKRLSRRLNAPVLCLMKPGWSERKASAALKRAARDVQVKATLLSATAENPNEITDLVEIPSAT